jgi:hypothetical protein
MFAGQRLFDRFKFKNIGLYIYFLKMGLHQKNADGSPDYSLY